MNAPFRVLRSDEHHTIASVFGASASRQRGEKVSRELIPIGSRGRFSNIIVIRYSTGQAPASWGQGMSNRRGGQMLKNMVPRQPNGQPRRPTLKQMKEIEAEKRLGETSVVLKQPHRKDFGNHPWAGSALGRLCLRTKCRREIYDAAHAYFELKRRWGAAVQLPRGYDNGDATGKGGEGPAGATVRAWLEQIIKCEIVLGSAKRVNRYGLLQNLIIYDIEASADFDAMLVDGLRDLAVHLEFMKDSEHPYMGGR
jgi:hypothetical protein